MKKLLFLFCVSMILIFAGCQKKTDAEPSDTEETTTEETELTGESAKETQDAIPEAAPVKEAPRAEAKADDSGEEAKEQAKEDKKRNDDVDFSEAVLLNAERDHGPKPAPLPVKTILCEVKAGNTEAKVIESTHNFAEVFSDESMMRNYCTDKSTAYYGSSDFAFNCYEVHEDTKTGKTTKIKDGFTYKGKFTCPSPAKKRRADDNSIIPQLGGL